MYQRLPARGGDLAGATGRASRLQRDPPRGRLTGSGHDDADAVAGGDGLQQQAPALEPSYPPAATTWQPFPGLFGKPLLNVAHGVEGAEHGAGFGFGQGGRIATTASRSGRRIATAAASRSAPHPSGAAPRRTASPWESTELRSKWNARLLGGRARKPAIDRPHRQAAAAGSSGRPPPTVLSPHSDKPQRWLLRKAAISDSADARSARVRSLIRP
jgi:hypothetical protein